MKLSCALNAGPSAGAWDRGGDGANMKNVLAGIIIVVILVVLVAVFPLLWPCPSREASRKEACINNLRLIESAKDNWSAEYCGTNVVQLKWDHLCPFIRDLTNRIFCPSAQDSQRSLSNYTINPVGVPAVCNVVGEKGGHSLTNR